MRMLKELRQRAADLDAEEKALRAEAKGIYAAARKNADRKLTADQDRRDQEVKSRLADLEVEREANAAELRNEERLADLERGSPGTRVEVGPDLAADRPWESPGHFLQAVAVAGGAEIPGGPRPGSIDPRLMAGPSGGSTSVPGDGGFPVRTDFSTQLLDRAVEQSVLAPLCDTYEVSEASDGVEMPTIDETSRATGSRWGGVQVYRRKEAASVTAVKPKYGEFECRLEDLMALVYMTGRQLSDAALTQQIVEKGVSSEFAFKMDDEIVRGNGAGEMTGILNSPALVTIAKETNQAADTLVVENLSKMWTAMPSRLKGGSFWFVNGELGPQLDALALVVGVGALEPRFVTYGPDGVLRIKGRPVQEIEQASAPGDLGDILLVNPMEFLLVRKGGTQRDESIHVRFVFDEKAFRFITRVNGKGKWRSAVAPYKGSVSKSPFVTLAAR